jgi:hypothetical protein
MTFIVRKPHGNNSGPLYDIVTNAGSASVTETGILTLKTGSMEKATVAVYAAGQWLSAFEDGGVKQARNDHVGQPLSEALLAKPKD